MRSDFMLGLDVQRMTEDGEDAVRSDDGCYSGYHSLRGGLAHVGGAIARLNTPKASRVSDEEPEERTFADAEQKTLELDSLHRASQVFGCGNVQHANGDDKTAGYADQVGKGTKERHD